MITTTIDLLRHGEVQGGACYRGSTDDPLTARGGQQMARQTDREHWDVVISSPLSRCRTFAEQLSAKQNIALQIKAGWREIDFGDWEGKTAEQIEQDAPQALENYYRDPVNNTPPNGEDHRHFEQRITNAWNDALSGHAGQHILVITHGGVIRMLFSQLLQIPIRQSFQIEINHASLSRFKCYRTNGENFVQLNFHKPL